MWAAITALAGPAVSAPVSADVVEAGETALGIVGEVCHATDARLWFRHLAPERPLVVSEMVARGVRIGERTQQWTTDGTWTVERLGRDGRVQRVHVRFDRRVGGDERAELLVMADGDCSVLGARRLRYEDGLTPAALDHLDASLAETLATAPLNPPVPAGGDPGGVPVALVDAGVNYLLPEIGRQLARDGEGRILGYDFWDLDRRPFDADPSASPFFPRHHGTRTASLLLAEASPVRLVPFRYPRPDMARMGALVDRAAAAGVRIVNLSLGSSDRDEWREFAAAAGRHDDMLFILSAGNDGRDIDVDPVFPAALSLENLVVATSAGDDRLPAPGSNWGKRSVDLLVPAEEMIVVDFDGHVRLASGSSYAAVRVSALAACLLGAHPEWKASELRRALFALAEPDARTAAFVARGYLPDPVEQNRGSCAAEPHGVAVTGVESSTAADATTAEADYLLAPSFVLVGDAGWRRDAVRQALDVALGLLAQCGIAAPRRALHIVTGPQRVRYYHRATAAELVRALDLPPPLVFFVKDTLAGERYDAHSFGRANSAGAPWLADTVWVMSGARDAGVALAHELFHVLADSGEHSDDARNLMHPETSAVSTTLTAQQCARARQRGAVLGMLRPRQ